uniref:Uncharacterized protein n=1 Tax=Aureoumbra lagunensis TaxID=44058 RepID=A0A7S3K5I3_9STRA
MRRSFVRPMHKRRRWRGSRIVCSAIALSVSVWCFAIRLYFRSGTTNKNNKKAIERLAFLFLVRDEVTTSLIWEAFFTEAKVNGMGAYFSIYTHPRPGYQYDVTSIFYKTEILNRTQVTWGAISVVRAEVLLLRAALFDNVLNTRFILVSEKCAPLHPFGCFYEYAMSAPALVASWHSDDRRSLYDFSQIYPHIQWRKGHQWVLLTRIQVQVVAANDYWYNTFYKAHASTPIAAEFRQQFKHKFHHSKAKDPDFIHHNFADEHFVQSILATEHFEHTIYPMSPTFIRFGNPDHFLQNTNHIHRRRRRLSALDITKKMKKDWRATTYQPRHIGKPLLDQARALCRLESKPMIPRTKADDDPRSQKRFGVAPWSQSSPQCTFSTTATTLCYLLIRKIPQETVLPYLNALWPHFLLNST